uniref:Uncharacterized protein n=1 Tax=Magallana gigas TaxID=29159 RepID=K1R238_MAGGI
MAISLALSGASLKFLKYRVFILILFRDVHRYIVDNGIVKIKLHLEQLKKDTSDLKQCEEVFPLVFEIGKATCAIMCMISTHLAKRENAVIFGNRVAWFIFSGK